MRTRVRFPGKRASVRQPGRKARRREFSQMLPPLNNDRDVRKYARENIGGRTEDMEKALDTLATNAPNSDVQDVANVGLMAM